MPTYNISCTITGTPNFPPSLILEGQEITMFLDNKDGSWNFGPDSVPVEGMLDIHMRVKGWNGSGVGLIVTCNGTEKTFDRTIKKGWATVEESLTVPFTE